MQRSRPFTTQTSRPTIANRDVISHQSRNLFLAPDQARGPLAPYLDPIDGLVLSSSAAPTIVFREAAPHIVIGAPGGSYIAPAVAQGIMNVIDFGMGMLEAVAAPRVVAVSDIIDVSNRVPLAVTDALEADGYAAKRNPQGYAFAALHGIRIEDGRLDGGADPQRDGMAMRVD